MPDLKIGSGEWVVVCDGGKALILENAGDARFPHLRTREAYEQKHPATHELGSDVPGRAFASVGNTRSAVEQTDWHRQSERDFLKALASRLDTAVTTGEVDSLIMAAPPRALGIIRQAYSPHVRQAIRAELEKDYVKLPVSEIETHLCGRDRKR
ncbi:MAG: host attachment protein [Alphaproteobacteria bacterium]|nr:MAG: host attachment protein [Alphaproteobacteria bacterium]